MSLSQTWAAFKLLHLSKPAGERVLYKTVRGHSITSVLEINIADLERTERLVGWLRQQGSGGPIRWAAIDLFEMSPTGSKLGLKQFHQKLSSMGLKPLPIPGTAEQGLPRVSNTLGAIDLVIMDLPDGKLDEPLFQSLLGRVIHQKSILLSTCGERTLQLLSNDRFQSTGIQRQVA